MVSINITYNSKICKFLLSIENVKSEEQNIEEDVQMQLANTFEAIPRNINIGGIVEKHANKCGLATLHFSKETGFPKAKRRDVSNFLISLHFYCIGFL